MYANVVTLMIFLSHDIQSVSLTNMVALVLFFLFLALFPIYHHLTKNSTTNRLPLPPGSMGLPLIGHSVALLRAMRSNTAEKWLDDRIHNYGPVSKLSLFGQPTVFLPGPTGNKLVFTSEELTHQQPLSVTKLVGTRNILELSGEEHKRVRGALVQFLRVDVLKKFVGKIDGEVRHQIASHWVGRQHVTVMPLMKSLTFDIISSLVFGLERGPIRSSLLKEFKYMMEGMWALPLNLPFTHFSKSLKASKKVRKEITRITKEKRIALEQGHCSSHDDLIIYLLSLNDDSVDFAPTVEEIVDNAIILMLAGFDTTSILITFMIRQLANDPITYDMVVQEQEEITKTKTPGEALTWDDLSKMKYTWWVAMETLRTVPPVFGMFRKALTDIEFAGYLIPKGWQVFWSTTVTHRDATIFNEPTKFNPSRFNNLTSFPPYTFVPFGGGARICPGNELVRLETLVTMHYLATRFKWKLASKDNSYSRNIFPSPAEGLPIELVYKRDL